MRKRSISMFWKFVFSYALVLMISFGFLFAVVWNSICSLNEAVIDSNWFQFINGVESINAIAADVEMLSARISKDSQLNSMLELSDGSQPLDYTDIYEVVHQYRILTHIQRLLELIYFCWAESKMYS